MLSPSVAEDDAAAQHTRWEGRSVAFGPFRVVVRMSVSGLSSHGCSDTGVSRHRTVVLFVEAHSDGQLALPFRSEIQRHGFVDNDRQIQLFSSSF